MTFTSFAYFIFFISILIPYWSLGWKKQNVLLLIGSFVFYGWVTPWFCLLLGTSILVDYFCGLAIDDSNHPGVTHRTIAMIEPTIDIELLEVWVVKETSIPQAISPVSKGAGRASADVVAIKVMLYPKRGSIFCV